jgi:hypothetical protein
MKHSDEARRDAVDVISEFIGDGVERSVLIDDLYLRIKVVVWLSGPNPRLAENLRIRLAESLGPFWSGDLLVANQSPDSEREVFEALWDSANVIGPNLRQSERIRSHGFWLDAPSEPVWSLPDDTKGVPVIAFYSFKGGWAGLLRSRPTRSNARGVVSG